ncbi:MAG: autotransporter outer membrane beta-barrel domain-containing protein, partial [Xanthomonadaceae bacterium]|nr:autotransporter outer membrane beta-barrel domain-containing protein [Xanthomonadaceae bacterium]
MKHSFSRKKLLASSIVLALSSGTAAADCTFTDTTVWNPGAVNACTGTVTITTSQNGGITPLQGHGLYANNSTWNPIGVTLNITTTGVQADAIRTNGNATLTLGDGLTVFTSGLSADAINLTRDSAATLNIGDNANLTTTASSFIIEGAHVVRANNSTNGGANTINIGSNARITTRGNNSWGVLAGLGTQEIVDTGIANKGSSKITIGDHATIRTEGNGAYGVYGNTRRSTIVLGDDLTITTNAANKGGSNAHGIYGTNGAAIELQGSANISVNPVNSYTILAGREVVVRSAGFDAAVSDGSSSRIVLNGMIRADKSKILDGTDNSANRYLDDHGGLVQLRMGGDSVLTRNDWSAGQDLRVIEVIHTSVDTQEVGVNRENARIELKTFDNTVIQGAVAATGGGEVSLDLYDRTHLTGSTVLVGTADPLTGDTAFGIIDMSLNNAGVTWDVTPSAVASGLSGETNASAVTSLALANGARVNLGGRDYTLGSASGRVQLDVENLRGNGIFEIRPYIVGIGAAAENQGDLLNITGITAGSHEVFIPSAELDLGMVPVDGKELLKVVQTADGKGAFALLDGRAVDIGHLKYTLVQHDGQNWYLAAQALDPDPGPDPGPSPSPEPESEPELNNTADAATNLLNVNYLLSYIDTQTLLQRMGDLRHTRQGDVWARVYTGRLDSFGDRLLSGFKRDYNGVQVGADRRIEVGADEFFLGGMLGYAKADPKHGYGNSDAESFAAAVYATYGTEDDFYVDGLAKFFRTDNNFKVRDSQGAWVTGDGSSNGYGASIEAGKRFYLDESREGFYIEPQAQVSYTHQSGLAIDASSGLRTRMDAYDSTLLRGSVLLGYNLKSDRVPINVYFKTGYVQELNGDVGIRYNGNARVNYGFDRGWWDNGIGLTAEINERHSLYVDIG